MAKSKKLREKYIGNCRLKIDVIYKMIEAESTADEWDFILHISRIQDEFGQANIYYKDVVNSIGISISHFYEVKDSLIQKGIIEELNINSGIYWTLRIRDNMFIYEEDFKAYVNTNRDFLHENDFLEAKRNIKILVMKLLIQARKNDKEEYYNQSISTTKLMEWLSISSERSLHEYIEYIKKWFKVKSLKKDNKYLIKLDLDCDYAQKSEKEHYLINKITYFCRIYKVKNISDKAVKDFIQLYNQYKANGNRVYMAFCDSITRDDDNEGNKRDRCLEPAYIRTLIEKKCYTAT